MSNNYDLNTPKYRLNMHKNLSNTDIKSIINNPVCERIGAKNNNNFITTATNCIVLSYVINNSNNSKVVVKKINITNPTDFIIERVYNEIFHYKIMTLLINLNITPHIVLYKGEYTATERDNKYIYILTEGSSNNKKKIQSLYDFLNNFEDNNTDKPTLIIRSIILQILYTLYIYHQIKFIHNDLHYGNILIVEKENKNETKYFHYIIDNNDEKIEFKIPNYGYEVRIFDFDLSSFTYTNDDIKFNSADNIKQHLENEDIFSDSAKKLYKFEELFDLKKFLYSVYFLLDDIFINNDIDITTNNTSMKRNSNNISNNESASPKPELKFNEYEEKINKLATEYSSFNLIYILIKKIIQENEIFIYTKESTITFTFNTKLLHNYYIQIKPIVIEYNKKYFGLLRTQSGGKIIKKTKYITKLNNKPHKPNKSIKLNIKPHKSNKSIKLNIKPHKSNKSIKLNIKPHKSNKSIKLNIKPHKFNKSIYNSNLY